MLYSALEESDGTRGARVVLGGRGWKEKEHEGRNCLFGGFRGGGWGGLERGRERLRSPSSGTEIRTAVFTENLLIRKKAHGDTLRGFRRRGVGIVRP